MHATMVLSVEHRLVVVFHGTAPETLDGHLHIRLTGTDPYLACEYIINRDLAVTIVKRDA